MATSVSLGASSAAMGAGTPYPSPGIERLPLLGREREREFLGELIERARQRQSGALVLRGEPGIGKTALLEDALERAEGMTVLRASGLETESELPFAGLSQLLGPLLPRLGELPPPQAAALSGALALGPPVPGDPFTTSVATLSLLAAGADDSGLVAAMDDAHWVDSASLQALIFAARRLSAEGVVLLFAAREGMASLVDVADLAELAIRGLDAGYARQLLDQTAPDLAPEASEAVLATAAGNPLALLEIPALITTDAATGASLLFEPLNPGSSLESAFLRRIEEQPAGVARALLVAAAADADPTEVVARALAAVDATWTDIERAERAGLITLAEDVRFRHPLMRAAVYHSAPADERRAAHRALADAMEDQPSFEQRAWHRALGTASQDEEVAAALEVAAAHARLRGAPGSAGRALELAVRLTPDTEGRARRLHAAGESLLLAGRTQRALELLEEALATSSDPGLRTAAQTIRSRALILASDSLEAHAILTAEALQAENSDPGHAALLHSEAAVAMMASARPRQVLESAERAYGLAERAGADPLLPGLVLGMALILVGNVARGGEKLLDAGISGLGQAGPALMAQWLPGAAATVATIGREEESRAQLAQFIAVGRALSAPGLLVFPLATLGLVEFRLGRWITGYAAALEALELSRQTGLIMMESWALIALAKIEAGRGNVSEWRGRAAAALDRGQASGTEILSVYARSALVLGALGEGAPQEAIVYGEPLARLWEERGYGEPGVANWHGDLIEAYAHAEQRADAERLLASLTEQAEQTGGAWALAVAARCRGLLAGEAEFEDAFAQSLQHHGRTPTPFERARTELCLGERRRRVKRRADAREPLRSALATFEELGARVWADRARAELRACGETRANPSPGPLEELTAHELQIALVVARGATNREAAAELFLSPKTVDFHLRNIYRKLGLRSRSELARMLALEQRVNPSD